MDTNLEAVVLPDPLANVSSLYKRFPNETLRPHLSYGNIVLLNE